MSVESNDRNVAKRQSQTEKVTELGHEEKEELAKMIKQDAEALQTLRNTLTVYNECSADITTILK